MKNHSYWVFSRKTLTFELMIVTKTPIPPMMLKMTSQAYLSWLTCHGDNKGFNISLNNIFLFPVFPRTLNVSNDDSLKLLPQMCWNFPRMIIKMFTMLGNFEFFAEFWPKLDKKHYNDEFFNPAIQMRWNFFSVVTKLFTIFWEFILNICIFWKKFGEVQTLF